MIVVLLLLLSSCVSTIQYVDFPEGKLDENETRIYIFRPGIYGSIIQMKIYEDDQLVGRLGPKSYLKWDIDRPIELTSTAENKHVKDIKLAPGKAHYFRQRVKLGWITARTKLERISVEEAKKYHKKLKKPRVRLKDISL